MGVCTHLRTAHDRAADTIEGEPPRRGAEGTAMSS